MFNIHFKTPAWRIFNQKIKLNDYSVFVLDELEKTFSEHRKSQMQRKRLHPKTAQFVLGLREEDLFKAYEVVSKRRLVVAYERGEDLEYVIMSTLKAERIFLLSQVCNITYDNVPTRTCTRTRI